MLDTIMLNSTRNLFNYYLDKIGEEKLEDSLGKIFSILRKLIVDNDKDRNLLVEGINAIIVKLGILVWPFLIDIFTLIKPIFLNYQLEGIAVLTKLMNVIEMNGIITTLASEATSQDEGRRYTAAITLAAVGCISIKSVIPLLIALSQSKKFKAKETCIMTIEKMLIIRRPEIEEGLGSMLNIIEECLSDTSHYIRVKSALSVASTARFGSAMIPTVEKFGKEILSILINALDLRLLERTQESQQEITKLLYGIESMIKVGDDKVVKLNWEIISRLKKLMLIESFDVALPCINMLKTIAERKDFVPPDELIDMRFFPVRFIGENNKIMRNASISTIFSIAIATGPKRLLECLIFDIKGQPDNYCNSMAIGLLSWVSGLNTVFPTLIDEYKSAVSDKIKNNILNAFAYSFEYIGENTKENISSVLSLIKNAIYDKDTRLMGLRAIKSIAVGMIGVYEEEMVDLLSVIWPYIFEIDPLLSEAVTEAIEAVGLGLQANILLTYITHGIKDPSKRVRDICWALYDNLYVGSEDLIAAFPQIPDEGFRRTELELFI
jgi:hypothetical protein